MPLYLNATIIAAVIAAIVSIITVVYTSRSHKKTSQSIIKLENDLDRHKEITLEYLKTYLAIEIENRNASLNAFREFLRLIQLFREKARRVMEEPKTFSHGLLKRELDEQCNRIGDIYAINQIFFDNLDKGNDRLIVHACKNECSKLAEALLTYQTNQEDSLKDKAQDLYNLISTHQTQIRIMAHTCANALIEIIKNRHIE